MQGFLVDAVTFAPDVPDLDRARIQRGEFRTEDIQEAMASVTGNIEETWFKHGRGRPTVGFATDRKHSRRLADVFRTAGVEVGIVDGETKTEEREETLAALGSGQIEMVWNVDVLTEGWDEPCVSCAIIARPTASVRIWLQQAGRVLRPFAGKDNALILDHAGNVIRHGLVHADREWTLEPSARKQRADGTGPPCRRCSECFAVMGVGCKACIRCGFCFPLPPGKRVVELGGELVEYSLDTPRAVQKDIAKKYGDKVAFWLDIEVVRKNSTHSPGWSLFQFKRRFNQFPTTLTRSYSEQVRARDTSGDSP
jgi:DNA repair protein RadD